MKGVADAGLPVSHVADLAAADPTRRWLVDGLWSQAAVGIIGGPPKAAKSWMALDMAVSVASNTPCLDTFDVNSELWRFTRRPTPVIEFLDHFRERLDPGHSRIFLRLG